MAARRTASDPGTRGRRPVPQVVPPERRGARLLDFLEGVWPEVDRRALRRLCADGHVRVNRMDADGRRKLVPGDVVEFELPDGDGELPLWNGRSTAPQAEPAARVIGETDFCLVVDKPAGVPTLADRAGRSAGVHGQLRALRPDEDLRVAHRLDRDTSGCLVLARDLAAARWLDRQFRERRVVKRYLALVEGRVARATFHVDRPLGPDPRRPGKVVVTRAGARGARDAHTDVAVAERFRAHTLLQVEPRTGRGHQIRVHLRAVGHPIVADVEYGAAGPLLLSAFKPRYKARPGRPEPPLLERMFLHSARVEVPRPDGGAPFVVECPLPDDLRLALDKLRRFAALRGGGDP